jgi:GcrA cell cycle regulator
VTLQPPELALASGGYDINRGPNSCKHEGWTAERKALAGRLWNDGLSASQIAKRLGGVSRNAVIGIIHRSKLSTRKKAERPTVFTPYAGSSTRRTGPTVRAQHTGRPVATSRLKPPTPIKADPEPINYENARAWTERRFGECAFPIGQGADLLSCCAPTERTYCKACERVMFKPEQPSKSKTMRIARWAA